MSDTKFKVGDRVIITDANSGPAWTRGEAGVVIEVESDYYMIVKMDLNGSYWAHTIETIEHKVKAVEELPEDATEVPPPSDAVAVRFSYTGFGNGYSDSASFALDGDAANDLTTVLYTFKQFLNAAGFEVTDLEAWNGVEFVTSTDAE